ncbi:hypothetical protein [Chitinophaga alhagiae]|uniref:hypothetical protein n=1 Tax=Chitinophaga alhagiae TaxID=2203219 RepID=UPI000E5B9AB8|nr:hypothetical protein [Chitinophaga alhagiae]
MKTYLLIFFITITCTLGFGCEDKTFDVDSLILYNTISEDRDIDSYDLEDMGKYHKQAYNDQKVLALIKSAKPSNDIFLWKGHIIGAFAYKHKDTVLIKISRYGGFFSIGSKVYKFGEKERRGEWAVLINDFVDKHTRETSQ